MSKQLEVLSDILNYAEIIDLSPLIEHNMPKWPTHPQIIVDPTITHEHDGYYCQTLVLGEHSGSHVDAPAHIHPAMMDKTIETYPANSLFGQAVVYDLSIYNPQPGEFLTVDQIMELEKKMDDRVGEGEIALLHFGWQQYWKTDKNWKYYALNAPGLSEDAAKLFTDRNVKAVGSDTAACDTAVKAGNEYHSYGHFDYWLPNEILIMEMLQNLDQIQERCYFIAIPLKISKGSGSPIRPLAVLVK